MQRDYAMSQPARLVTADEFERFPDDDFRYELVQGRVVKMSPPGFRHGALAIRLGSLLTRHVDANDLGVVVTETGFKLAADPDTVRGPDVAFVRRERIVGQALPKGFWPGPPDLAVEIVSPTDSRADVEALAREYLAHGVLLVLVVDPDAKSITRYRPLTPPATVGIDGAIDAGDVVPGFICPLRAIFG